MTTFRIRESRAADQADVLALVPRLRAFGSQSLRTDEDLDRAEHEALTRAFGAPSPAAAILVAEHPSDAARIAGVAYVETATDYFTREQYAHLAILAVDEAMEGMGAGRALLRAMEEWALARGHRMVTLNVFAANSRARAVYERAGYAADTMRYAKQIAPRRSPDAGGEP